VRPAPTKLENVRRNAVRNENEKEITKHSPTDIQNEFLSVVDREVETPGRQP